MLTFAHTIIVIVWNSRQISDGFSAMRTFTKHVADRFLDHANYNQLLSIFCATDDLGLLYSVNLLDHTKKKGTPIGDHIDRVGLVFYEVA